MANRARTCDLTLGKFEDRMTPAPKFRLDETLLVLVVFTAAAAAMFATAPTALDFWWSDAPRHALNGVFVRDLLAELPVHDPVGWANAYYARYPALTILFYPPAFYLVEAGFYALFGVSHAVAQLSVLPYTILLGVSATAIARRCLPLGSAIGVGLLAVGTPLSALWGRQVMLDVPAYALLMASMWCLLLHARTHRTLHLALAALAFVAAVYTKQTAIFILPALLVGFLRGRGFAALGERRVLVIGLLAVIAAIPLVVLTVKFGAVNVQSVAGRPGDLPRFSPGAWLFYPAQLPAQLGWPPLVLGAGGLLAVLFRPPLAGPVWGRTLLLAWLIGGYVFFSLIAVREPRHDMMALFPLLLGVGFAFHLLLPSTPAQVGVLVVAGLTIVHTVILQPVPVVSGYAKVADIVAHEAAAGAVVLFSGYRDGNFIYALRTHAERGDISTLRADKLLLTLSIERERGVAQADLDEAGIAKLLHDRGVGMIVEQVGFWTDLREMARLERVINSGAYRLVAEVPITGTLSTNDGRDRPGGPLVRIFRPVAGK